VLGKCWGGNRHLSRIRVPLAGTSGLGIPPPAVSCVCLACSPAVWPTTFDEGITQMNIDKNQITQLLRDQGHPQADQAEQELPNQVDTEQHADLLSKFGLNPQELLGKLGSGGLGNLI
jgi:hypothetical protein